MSLRNDNGSIAEWPGTKGNPMDPFSGMGPPSLTGGAGGDAGPSSAGSTSTMGSPFIFQPGGSSAERVASWIVPGVIALAAIWLLKK